MKKIAFQITFLLQLIILTNACTTKETHFFIRYQSAVSQNSSNQEIVISSENIALHAQQTLEQNNTKKSKVSWCELRNIYLLFDTITTLQEITSPKKIILMNASEKMKEVQFEKKYITLDTNCIKIQLEKGTTNLKELIKGDSFRCQLIFDEKLFPKKSTAQKIQLEFLVKGELIKVILHQRILV